jgi:hypothetical protein
MFFSKPGINKKTIATINVNNCLFFNKFNNNCLLSGPEDKQYKIIFSEGLLETVQEYLQE